MQKKLIVRQQGRKDCGAAALLSIIRYYKGDISLTKLLELTNTTKNGTTFYDIKYAATYLGLVATGYKINEEVKYPSLPFISQIISNNYTHFVVVYKELKNSFLIMDPACGKRVIKKEEFYQMWTGNIMTFAYYKKLPIINEKNYIKKIIFEVLSKNKSLIILCLISSLIISFNSLFCSYQLKFFQDNFAINNLLYIFIYLIILRSLASLTKNQLIAYLNMKLDINLFIKATESTIYFPYNYYKTKTTGEIISKISDISYIRNLINKIILTVLFDLLMLIISAICLYHIHKMLFGLSLIIVIFYVIIMIIFNPQINKLVKKQLENNSLVNTNLIEAITNFETVKGLNIESKILNKIEFLYTNGLKNILKLTKINNVCEFFKELIISIVMLLINFYGIKEISKGNLEFSTLIVFNTILMYFLDPIKNIIDITSDYYMAKNALKRANTLFEITKEDLQSSTNLNVLGNINIKTLNFSYGQKEVLHDISLEIKQNEKVLILGSSGSGKSTLLKILYKYHNVKRDVITINGYDINDYSLNDIRKNITYVSQNEMLFTSSIKQNIVLQRNINTKEFLDVASYCFVDEIVKNNILGYDMLLEENGINISGGERQRIILARSILKKSSIMLIDEGLNQIDINLERKILKQLFKNYPNTTFIIVSHRLDNMDLYDKVIKMQEGKITDISLRSKNDL